MINAITTVPQTITPTNNVIFTGYNVRSNSCKNGCSGWLNNNENSGLFQITKPGYYLVTFNGNVAPTVAGAITLNITEDGENIAGGEMLTPGTTAEVFENVSATVLINVPCNCCETISVKNNTPTNPIIVDDASLTIVRVA